VAERLGAIARKKGAVDHFLFQQTSESFRQPFGYGQHVSRQNKPPELRLGKPAPQIEEIPTRAAANIEDVGRAEAGGHLPHQCFSALEKAPASEVINPSMEAIIACNGMALFPHLLIVGAGHTTSPRCKLP